MVEMVKNRKKANYPMALNPVAEKFKITDRKIKYYLKFVNF